MIAQSEMLTSVELPVVPLALTRADDAEEARDAAWLEAADETEDTLP